MIAPQFIEYTQPSSLPITHYPPEEAFRSSRAARAPFLSYNEEAPAPKGGGTGQGVAPSNDYDPFSTQLSHKGPFTDQKNKWWGQGGCFATP